MRTRLPSGRGCGGAYPAVMTRPLLVKCTCGADAPERANQALTVAATAVAAGARVDLWLTGEGAWLAVPGRADDLALDHATPARDLLAAVLAGGSVTVCTQCAARRGLVQDDLLEGVRVAGSASFVEQALAVDVQALVY
jgi:predicted peroxiredoxin